MEMKDLYWLAGLLEGEGCFRFASVTRSGGRTPELTLAMSDRDVVERAARLMAPTKRITEQVRPARKPMYMIRPTGSRAVGLMMTLFPLLGVRRRAAVVETLKLWKSVSVMNHLKTCCIRGHVFDEANTKHFVQTRGRGRSQDWKGRQCRQCLRDRNRAFAAEKRAAFIGPRRPGGRPSKEV